MRASADRPEPPRWEYRLWEFDPTWPDADDGPEVSGWAERSTIERMFRAAIEDPQRKASRQIRVQRRAVTYGDADPTLLDAVPDWNAEVREIDEWRAGVKR